MPKDRRTNSSSLDRTRVSPYPCSPRITDSKKSEGSLPPTGDEKEWEETRCPICMEHPHNAVLLLCSSCEKGCRPYMCDTSYRHSNCLDQFRKSTSSAAPIPLDGARAENNFVPRTASLSGIDGVMGSRSTSSSILGQQLVCPLCRGQISGWVVIESARKFMNLKARSCSLESCEFRGTYEELRKHARVVHPSIRPAEADPRRQNDWTRLARQRDLEDALSAYRSESEHILDDMFDWNDANDFDDDALWGGESYFDFLDEMEVDDEDTEDTDVFNLALDYDFGFSFTFVNEYNIPVFFDDEATYLDSTRSNDRLSSNRPVVSRSTESGTRSRQNEGPTSSRPRSGQYAGVGPGRSSRPRSSYLRGSTPTRSSSSQSGYRGASRRPYTRSRQLPGSSQHHSS